MTIGTLSEVERQVVRGRAVEGTGQRRSKEVRVSGIRVWEIWRRSEGEEMTWRRSMWIGEEEVVVVVEEKLTAEMSWSWRTRDSIVGGRDDVIVCVSLSIAISGKQRAVLREGLNLARDGQCALRMEIDLVCVTLRAQICAHRLLCEAFLELY